VKLRLIEKDHRLSRGGVAEPEVSVEDLLLARAEVVNVVTLASRQAHWEFKAAP
jgi:hypothetical protein